MPRSSGDNCGCGDNRRHLQSGIEDRIATFETRLRTPDDILSWFDALIPSLWRGQRGNRRLRFHFDISPRDCYKGIAEVSCMLLDRDEAGSRRLVLQALITACQEAGFWKLCLVYSPTTRPAAD